MNTKIACSIAVLFGVLGTHNTHAQGSVTYVSNLGQPSSGSVSVGSNSWYAADFITGANASGYLLNSVQLQMTDASGTPNGFSVMIYSSISGLGTFPGSNLGQLTGSTDPATGGVYTYTPGSSLALSPNAVYFVVLTANTSVANGAYGWSVTSAASPGYNSYHWGGEIAFQTSSDGLNWGFTSANYGQFALNATAAPEPGVVILLAMGGLLIGVKQWNGKKRS